MTTSKPVWTRLLWRSKNFFPKDGKRNELWITFNVFLGWRAIIFIFSSLRRTATRNKGVSPTRGPTIVTHSNKKIFEGHAAKREWGPLGYD